MISLDAGTIAKYTTLFQHHIRTTLPRTSSATVQGESWNRSLMMLSCNADHDAFTWDGLVNIPDLDSPTTWPNVHVVDLQSLTTGLLALVEEQIVKTKLPALSTSFFKLATDDVALPSLDHSGDSANASDHEEQDAAKQSQHTEPDADSLEELWMLPDIVAPQRKPVLTSWDHFHNEDHIDPRPHYLSELGALTFNAALNKYVGTRPTKEVIFEPFLYGLIELGLGRESVFFAWDEKQNKMMRREEIEQYKVTDFSEISIQSVIEDMLGIGTIYRTLKHRHSQIDRRSKGFATWQALNAAIGSVLAGIERHMEIVRGDAVSILQIQSSFARPGQLLKAVSDLVNEFLDSGQNVARTLVAAFKVAEDVSERSSWLQNIVQKFVQNVSLPLLRGVGEELLGNCACGLGEPSRPHCQVLIESALLSQESKDLLRKTLDNLDMLSSLPDTSSASRQPISDGHESLSYEYSTAGFDILHGKAKRLEQSLIDAIVICRQDTKAFSAHDEQGPLDMWDRGLELINPWLLDLDLSSPLGPNKHDSGLATEDVLTETVCQDIGCIQPPSHLNIDFPLQHMESSILPFVLARYRATTYSLLSSIMQQDHLAEHLTLNLKYQLFGNPFFAKRISTALFDAAQTSSEGRRKVAGSGLRLQARDKWPPTSSEVRVALMHVLSESFLVSKEQVSYSKITNNMDKLDETISFAIRDLTDTELEACRDVNSIHALDFSIHTIQALKSVAGNYFCSPSSQKVRSSIKVLTAVTENAEYRSGNNSEQFRQVHGEIGHPTWAS